MILSSLAERTISAASLKDLQKDLQKDSRNQLSGTLDDLDGKLREGLWQQWGSPLLRGNRDRFGG